MKIFDIFRRLKPKKEPKKMLESVRTGLPQDLERFRVRKGPLPEPEPISPSPYQAPVQEAQLPPRPGLPAVGPAPKGEKIVLEKEDMILQKLETIDARLRLIEEKIK